VTIPAIEIKFVNRGKDLSVYHLIHLKNVLVSQYSFRHVDAGSSTQHDDSKHVETMTLNFTKFEITNTPHTKDHKAGSPITAGYDLEITQPL
jgi:type VI protein secretion system component Hcp